MLVEIESEEEVPLLYNKGYARYRCPKVTAYTDRTGLKVKDVIKFNVSTVSGSEIVETALYPFDKGLVVFMILFNLLQKYAVSNPPKCELLLVCNH
ncbi:hypothetical protein AVEN_16794-1 [Araneus ventricosus]|uniref:Uncharacterized protein n=1 Tax=Araneus ventricosus TaxID=182803 RepID=A0A4Y2BRH5_ARAVE|nr:hypothetical protein AVEN_16794-1 [Araneus ventricosus]